MARLPCAPSPNLVAMGVDAIDGGRYTARGPTIGGTLAATSFGALGGALGPIVAGGASNGARSIASAMAPAISRYIVNPTLKTAGPYLRSPVLYAGLAINTARFSTRVSPTVALDISSGILSSAAKNAQATAALRAIAPSL